MTAKNQADTAETHPGETRSGEAPPGRIRDSAQAPPEPAPALDFDVEIDFDQIVHDPDYRRHIIRRLNAAASSG